MDEINERLRRIQSDFETSKQIYEPFGNISEKEKNQLYLLIFVLVIIFNKEIISMIKKYLY
tara:strand:- start:141 stop:323 length:183 start_codon:yes stop_codon:yes gene_type:complete